MSVKKRIKGPISKFEPKALDEDLFFKLFDILHDNCFDSNRSATARALGLHQNTVKKWSVTPPTMPWWNHILHTAIMDVYRAMANSTHKKIRKRAQIVLGALHRAELHSMKEYIEFNEANNSEVRRAVLVALLESPTQSLTSKDMKKAGVLGAYNQSSVREACDQLTLVKTTSGFGGEKVVTYRLPTGEDL